MPVFVTIDDTEVAPEAPVTSSLMTRLRDNAMGYLGAAVGTRIIVHNAIAPLGWTLDAGQTNKGIRIAGGAIPGGGSMGFTQCFALRNSEGHILDTTQLANFTPTVTVNGLTYGLVSADTIPSNYVVGTPGVGQSNTTAIQSLALTSNPVGGSLSFLSVGGNQPHVHAMDLRLAYIDVNVVEKDA